MHAQTQLTFFKKNLAVAKRRLINKRMGKRSSLPLRKDTVSVKYIRTFASPIFPPTHIYTTITITTTPTNKQTNEAEVGGSGPVPQRLVPFTNIQ